MANIFQTTVRSKSVAAGTSEYGFGGEVPVSELWNGRELASLLGITQGTAINIDEPWLKFYLDGKVILKSKKTFRHTISWNHLNEKGVVYGDKIIEDKYGNQYKVRLMKGALTDPSKSGNPDEGAKGSEWNKLILPIHEHAKNKKWKYPKFVEPDIPSNWGIDYTNADLGIGGSGAYQWCQETAATDSAKRVFRNGMYGPANSDSEYATRINNMGWSPVLELIELAPHKLLLRHTKTGKIYTIKEGSFS